MVKVYAKKFNIFFLGLIAFANTAIIAMQPNEQFIPILVNETGKFKKNIIIQENLKLTKEKSGNQNASTVVQNWVSQALTAMGKKNPQKTAVYKLSPGLFEDRAGFANPSGIWIAEPTFTFAKKFTTFHEAGHVACEHTALKKSNFFERVDLYEKDGEMQIDQKEGLYKRANLSKQKKEYEADKAAIHALLSVGDSDTVARAYLHKLSQSALDMQHFDHEGYPNYSEKARYQKEIIIEALQKYPLKENNATQTDKFLTAITCQTPGERMQRIEWASVAAMTSMFYYLANIQKARKDAIPYNVATIISGGLLGYLTGHGIRTVQEKLWLTQVGLLDPKRRDEQLKVS